MSSKILTGSGGAAVHVGVEGRDDRVVEGELDVEEARNFGQKWDEAIFVHLGKMHRFVKVNLESVYF